MTHWLECLTQAFAQGIFPFLPPSWTHLALGLLKTSVSGSGQVISISIPTSIGQDITQGMIWIGLISQYNQILISYLYDNHQMKIVMINQSYHAGHTNISNSGNKLLLSTSWRKQVILMKTYGLSTHCDLWLRYTASYSANAGPPALYVNNIYISICFIGVVLINLHSIVLLSFLLLLGSQHLI